MESLKFGLAYFLETPIIDIVTLLKLNMNTDYLNNATTLGNFFFVDLLSLANHV